MAGILRKIMPVVPSSPKQDTYVDSINSQYSIAIEYSGPLLSQDVPRALPVADDQIPFASIVDSSSLINPSQLLIVQPFPRSKAIEENGAKKTKPSSKTRNHGRNEARTSGRNKGCIGRDNSSGDLRCTNEQGSNVELESVDCHENVVELPDDSNQGVASGFQDYMNPGSSESTGSGSSSRALSSEVFSCKDEEVGVSEETVSEETPPNVERPLVVTFIDPDRNDSIEDGESSHSETESVMTKPQAGRTGKKGTCYRCLKGNRFTEKEVCIVCGAKYCSSCVIRAMGSMPEGRKCIVCIGFRIDEGKRGNLGKCSWMLKRLLTEVEVKRIMESEVSCEANQLPPELVFVNGEVLSHTELFMLQSSQNPPKSLSQGEYWYDKVSGLWGKVGHGPCHIISPELNVGGPIMRNVSNGNTNVLINGREITKKELWMLKSAGVQCEGQPHFWVDADGSYREEGQNRIKGRIWDKIRIKLVCAILSLPTRPSSADLSSDGVDTIQQKTLHKLLLTGDVKSGTSTIYKHAKIVYKVPFAEGELQNIKSMIQSNLYRYLGILLKGRQKFEEECLNERRKRQAIDQSSPSGQNDEKTIYSINPRQRAFSEWLLKVMESGNLEAIFPAATREYAPSVEELWRDAAVQATYNRRSELEMLPRNATYFLERAVDISRADYELSENDILYAEGITSSNGISSMEFSFSESRQDSLTVESSCQKDSFTRYQLIRVHPSSLGDNCKWLEMFEDIDLIVFCVSLTDYDEYIEDDHGVLTNKMLASKRLFENIITYKTFKQKNVLLLLNKFDLLEEKIEHNPLSRCEWFDDFNPVISHNHRNRSRSSTAPLAQRAFHYIAVKFKRLFQSLTERKLYVSMVTGLEPESVDESFKYAREILRWEGEEIDYSNMETSITDCDASTSS